MHIHSTQYTPIFFANSSSVLNINTVRASGFSILEMDIMQGTWSSARGLDGVSSLPTDYVSSGHCAPRN